MRKFFVTVALLALCGPAQADSWEDFTTNELITAAASVSAGLGFCPNVELGRNGTEIVNQAFARMKKEKIEIKGNADVHMGRKVFESFVEEKGLRVHCDSLVMDGVLKAI